MTIRIHQVKKEELKEYYQMQIKYLDKDDFSEFLQNVDKYKGLYLCAVDNGKIVGVVYPGTYNGEMYLRGICVDLSKKLNDKGIGSKLIKAFEKKMAQRGLERITVGSAEEPRAENFYLKNGWQPTQLVVKKIEKLPSNYKEIIKKENLSEDKDADGKTLVLRTPVTDYESGKILRERLEKELNAKECIFILEKKLKKK